MIDIFLSITSSSVNLKNSLINVKSAVKDISQMASSSSLWWSWNIILKLLKSTLESKYPGTFLSTAGCEDSMSSILLSLKTSYLISDMFSQSSHWESSVKKETKRNITLVRQQSDKLCHNRKFRCPTQFQVSNDDCNILMDHFFFFFLVVRRGRGGLKRSKDD